MIAEREAEDEKKIEAIEADSFRAKKVVQDLNENDASRNESDNQSDSGSKGEDDNQSDSGNESAESEA